MTKGFSPVIPDDCPKESEVYKHYKGDLYRVLHIALHSNDGEWMVVYEPLYENPDAKYFTRPLREWGEEVMYEGKKVVRFLKERGMKSEE